MSREYLELGPVPIEEECAQVGELNFIEKAKRECKTYAKQLVRMYPDMEFAVRGFNHDFGKYYEVIVFYDPENPEAVDKTYELEANLPYRWDDIARAELQGSLNTN